ALRQRRLERLVGVLGASWRWMAEACRGCDPEVQFCPLPSGLERRPVRVSGIMVCWGLRLKMSDTRARMLRGLGRNSMDLKRKALWRTPAISLAVLVLLSLGPVAPVPLSARHSATRGAANKEGGRSSPTADSTAVLVELFTSEGCSSCPPADKLLSDLDEAQPIAGARVIALSEHVDYWNHLGWKDPFSSAEFSRRQTEYERLLGVDDAFTPQMIVDGRIQFVGSNSGAAREAIAKAARSPKADVSLAIKALAQNSVAVSVRVENVAEVSGGAPADVVLAITESGLLSSVVRGENAGRKLAHSAVTRKLTKIGAVEGKTFSAERSVDLDSRWKRQNMKAVAFVQERSGRRVFGAASIKLIAEP